MNKQTSIESDKAFSPERQPAADKSLLISVEAFLAADFEAPIALMNSVQSYQLSSVYLGAARDARSSGDKDKASVYVFLGGVMGIHLRATDKASPWGPHLEMTDGRRSMIPSDAKDQLARTIDLLPHIHNPVLKARIADLIWSNDKRQSQAATIAIDCYAEIVAKLLDRTLCGYDDQKADYMEASHFLQRGINIANAISRKGALPESITHATKALYDAAKNNDAYVVCADTAELGCRTGVLDQKVVAQELEEMVCAASPEMVADAVRKASDFAAYIYGRLNDEKGKERCQLHSVRLLLAMSDHCPQAGAKASWVMNALQTLGRMRGFHEQKAELKRILRELQDDATHEVMTFSIPLGIEDEHEATYQKFLGYNLSDALKNFALLSAPPSKEKLRQEAIETMRTAPLLANMPMAHMDGKGKTIAKTDGAGFGQAPDEDWFDTTISRSESLRRQIVMGAAIDPARQAICVKYSITEDHLEPIVAQSWVVPQSQKPNMILGFTRLIQGDFMSAAHLILPQLEPCLRNMLHLNGVDTAKRRNDSTEEDLDLGAMFRNHRADFERILGVDLTYEIELIFDRMTGNRLRHVLAHGSLAGYACYSPDVVYACWLMYRLCCLPILINDWHKTVGPHLQGR